MASSGNFCTMNQVDPGVYQTITGGGLIVGGTGSSTADQAKRGATFYVNSGKWYWEVRQTVGGSSYGEVGISVGSAGTATPTANSGFSEGLVYQSIAGTLTATAAGYLGLGTITTTSTGVSAISSNQVINIALDMDNRKLFFGLDGTYFNSGDPANGTNPQFSWTTDTFVTPTSKNYAANRPSHYNFGQDSTFAGNETAGGNADGNGHGDFHSSVPTGFLSLCSSNLSISEDIDPAETDDNYPAKNFNAVLYTGNASTNAISGLGFQPDLFWFNRRSNAGAYGNGIVDSSRGAGLGLYPNRADADTTFTSDFDSFDSDGFTLNAGSSANINNSGQTFAAWCWKANGGTTTSFTASGDRLAGTYQANTNSKFSIITYTGNATADAEVLHGLGTTPNFIIFKARSNTHWWGIYLKSGGTVHTGYDSLLYLNSSNALASSQAVNIVPDSTKIVFSGNEQINTNAATYVMYAWADNEMQKFGMYEGNGNTNGPFVYTGFRPRMLILKDLDDAENWVQFDSARNTFNPVDKGVFPNSTAAETTGSGSGFDVDFLSNGFKLRCTHDNMNGSSTYVYACWGDVPFKYNNTF
jgi:hypothetical protein